MKEESVEGFLEAPKVKEESIPEQLKGALGQAAGALQQLPLPSDLMTNGMKFPLSKILNLSSSNLPEEYYSVSII